MRDLLDLLARVNAGRAAGEPDAAAERAAERTFRASGRLAAYGTLAPGEPHHHLLDGCRGEWSAVTVRGRLGRREFPVFTADAHAEMVRMQLFTSAALARHWEQLDAFEGPDYRRILVAATGVDGHTVVANLYEAVAPVGCEPPRSDSALS